ncbi:MAG: tRNA dihydrouridine synthase DusB [Hyphomonadaceae bacterium]
MVRLGDVNLTAPVFLAPMSGVTDAPFRTQAARFGAPAVVTEMVAGAELARKTPEFVRRAAPHDGAGPYIVQLACREPEWMAEGARLATAAGAEIIDINMGCPAKRVTGGQAGCALMREPELARALIAAAVSATDRPVTVKMRLGWDDRSLNAAEIARIAEGEGAQMITVHGRTRVQFYDGTADWSRIAVAVEATGLPVIANGDIATPEDARAAMAASGAAGVMIGRGAVGRPWRLAQIAAARGGATCEEPAREDKIDSLVAQVRASTELYGEKLGVRVVRKHVAAFVDAWAEDYGAPEVGARRGDLCRIEGADALINALGDTFVSERIAA